jgi:hypothetical protein
MEESPMPEARTYQGGCHCKAVRFETALSLDKVVECNCSICSRVGALRAFTPATRFKLLSGKDSLTDYQFGKQHLHHTFCKFCGVHAFASGKARNGEDTIAVNARCLDDVDPWQLEITHFEGKKL